MNLRHNYCLVIIVVKTFLNDRFANVIIQLVIAVPILYSQALVANTTVSPNNLTDSFFVVSNEDSPHLFAQDLVGQNGKAYLGVGFEQNYTLMALMNPQVAWLIDYQRGVNLGHELSRIAFISSKSPAEFVRFFKSSNEARAKKSIEQYASEDIVKELIKHHQRYSDEYETRFQELRSEFSGDNFLNKNGLYTRVRNIFLKGRVRILPGDILGGQILKDLRLQLAFMRMELGVVYFSNVLDYVIPRDSLSAKSVFLQLQRIPQAATARLLVTSGKDLPEYLPSREYWKERKDPTHIESWSYYSVPISSLINCEEQF